MTRLSLIIGMATIAAVAAYILLGTEGGPGAAVVSSPTPEQIAFADEAMPDDPALAAIYDRSCRACHGLDGAGAPLTGHGADWNARSDARGGLEALIASARDGYEDMPAMGLCNDCSDAQFGQLIEFMSKENS